MIRRPIGSLYHLIVRRIGQSSADSKRFFRKKCCQMILLFGAAVIESAMRYRFKSFSLLWIVALCLASPDAFADKASQQRMDRLLLSWCRQGNAEKVAELLVQGADPNAGLASAAQGGHSELAKLLVQAGAKMDVANDEGITPVRLAAIRGVKPIYDWLVAASGGTEPRTRMVPAATPDETTAELVKMLSSKIRKDRITAQEKLVAYGSAIMPEVPKTPFLNYER